MKPSRRKTRRDKVREGSHPPMLSRYAAKLVHQGRVSEPREVREARRQSLPGDDPRKAGGFRTMNKPENITPRDWFAGLAMVGFLASRPGYSPDSGTARDRIAADAYAQADAMMTVRERDQ